MMTDLNKLIVSCFRSSGFRVVLSTLLFLGISVYAWGRKIHIPSPHLATVQSGIDISRDGDTVLVSPGVYYENLDFKGKSILLASHFILKQDTTLIDETIIDGGKPAFSYYSSVVRFVSGEDSSSVIQGFTLRNGKGTRMDEFGYGGGIYCYRSAPTVINNHIEENEAPYGGGICCFYGNLSPKIISNRIQRNRGVVGGGVFSEGSNFYVQGNLIQDNFSSYRGGGIFFKLCSPKIMKNLISQNTTVKYGGGIYGLSSTVEIMDNWLEENKSELKGGGIYISGGSSAKIMGNIIKSNSSSSGGGLHNYYSSSLIANNTFVNNKGAEASGGIYCAGSSIYSFEFINNILYSNSGGIRCDSGSIPRISYNDFYNNANVNFNCEIYGLGDTAWGENVNGTACDSFFNIFEEPLFADNNYNLLCSSPCIGAGDSMIYSFQDEARKDIGARDYLYLRRDTNSDGQEDLTDVIFLINYLFKSGDAPCPVRRGDLNLDGKVSLADILILIHSLYKF